jgi:hypothetical protein
MKIIFAILILVVACCAQTPGVYRQGSASPAATSIATSASMNVATNDLIVACVGSGASQAGLDGLVVSDGVSNTLTCDSLFDFGTPGQLIMCYKAGAVANTAATWTATWSSTHSFRLINAMNYAGMATTNPLDQGPSCQNATCDASATSSNRTAVNLAATNNANDLLVACTYEDNFSDWTAANSFNLRATLTGADHMFADKTVSSTGVYPNGLNFGTVSTTTVNYLSKFAAFKAAPSSTPNGSLLGKSKILGGSKVK